MRPKTLPKEDFRDTQKVGRTVGEVCLNEGLLFNGINGSVSFTVIYFLNLNLHCIFNPTARSTCK